MLSRTASKASRRGTALPRALPSMLIHMLLVLLAMLLLSVFVFAPADALRFRPDFSTNALGAHSNGECTRKGIDRDQSLAIRGGGDNGDSDSNDKASAFDALIRRAQIDPAAVEDASNPLSGLARLKDAPGPLPDLMTVCTMAAVYTSGIFDAGMEEGKKAYDTLKVTFAKDFEEALAMGGITVTEEEQNDPSKDAQMVTTIQKCIAFLGSGYMHASFFSAESFRQQVLQNPFWQGLVKTALITKLGDDCPKFEELLQDGGLWSSTLMKCSE